MSSILEQAEARIAPAAATAKARQTEIVEAMREEIGRKHYHAAKQQLPKLEQAMGEIYRSFVARVATMEARAKAPLPEVVKSRLREMMTICDTVPNTVRNGIAGWDGLTVPLQPDGRTIDANLRATWVHDIRAHLNNWDGARGLLDSNKGQVEMYIKEANWPATLPSVA